MSKEIIANLQNQYLSIGLSSYIMLYLYIKAYSVQFDSAYSHHGRPYYLSVNQY